METKTTMKSFKKKYSQIETLAKNHENSNWKIILIEKREIRAHLTEIRISIGNLTHSIHENFGLYFYLSDWPECIQRPYVNVTEKLRKIGWAMSEKKIL